MLSMKFKLTSTYKPTGDQPVAIEKLTAGLEKGLKHQTLLGVTGSGKTFSLANVIQNVQKPTLVISHNKTLAAQLYQEFREFFPENAVSYFVSYYDYYQPEAYMPASDTYIEKETEVNEEIDKLRLQATASLATRSDVIVVASVSAIYNLGSPSEYQKSHVFVEEGQIWSRSDLLSALSRIHYDRAEMDFPRGSYRVRGESIEIYPAYLNEAFRLNFLGETVKSIEKISSISGQTINEEKSIVIYPAKHHVATDESTFAAMQSIKAELQVRLKELEKAGKTLESHRLKQRTNYDLEMMQTLGTCKGIENYSRHFDGRNPGDPPYSLLDHFAKDFLLVIDESHMTVPQINGMYNGDRARKQMLVDFGFRLPSAFDNRPLKFEEFARKINQVLYVSATPGPYELKLSEEIVEQVIRPTGLIDPTITIKPSKNQIPDLIKEIEVQTAKKQRALVTTLTKRMAEDLATFLEEKGLKVQYLHSDILTLDRIDILDDLRLGNFDVLVGINLLREGLDLPEVSLVAILDADKEGFLRSDTSLIQTMGRAARHSEGRVILYADKITGSMERAIEEVNRRRKIQQDYNKTHGITPTSINKPIRDKLIERQEEEEKEYRGKDEVIEGAVTRAKEGSLLPDDKEKLIKLLTREMKDAARALDFERAAYLRDQVLALKASQN
jgi:excinuclease ABC subunit B